MVSRRQFICGLGALPLAIPSFVWTLPRLPGTVLRVGSLTEASQSDLRRGLAFGAEEADHSAALFHWHVEHVELRPRDLHTPAQHSMSAVVVGVREHITAPGCLILRVTCSRDDEPDSFALVPRTLCSAQTAAGRETRLCLWDATLERFGAQQLNDRYRAAFGATMTSDAWLGWMAFKVLIESALRTRSSNPDTLRDYLRAPTTNFDGHKGTPLRFDGEGELVQPVYVMQRNSAGHWKVASEMASTHAVQP